MISFQLKIAATPCTSQPPLGPAPIPGPPPGSCPGLPLQDHRRPGARQLCTRKTAVRRTDLRAVRATLICVPRGLWPGVRRGGPPKAEPGADAGPAAPLSGVLMSQALFGADLAAVAPDMAPSGTKKTPPRSR
jgi:hypothetical protein